jgi:hypothetical protein
MIDVALPSVSRPHPGRNVAGEMVLVQLGDVGEGAGQSVDLTDHDHRMGKNTH